MPEPSEHGKGAKTRQIYEVKLIETIKPDWLDCFDD